MIAKNPSELSIGQFSRVSQLSIKTLRHYHALGLLVPKRIDRSSGYRFYQPEQLERAQAILGLKDLGFGLETITEILHECSEDQDIIDILETRRNSIVDEMNRMQARIGQLDSVLRLAQERKKRQAADELEVKECVLPEQLFISRRVQGRYETMGSLFKACGRAAGRHIAGPPMALFYDAEYCEVADFEAGFPVQRETKGKDLVCRVLPMSRAICVIHVGPYTESGPAWAVAIAAATAAGFSCEEKTHPPREIYLKGPGMIFRGQPKRYVTQICVVDGKDV